MEWMLQVIDEVDDAIGAFKHRWLGLGSEIGMPLVAGISMAVVGMAFAAHTNGVLFAAAAILSGMLLAIELASPRPRA